VRYSSQLISASVVGAPPLILRVIIVGFGFAALFTLFLFATALAETQRFPFHCVVVTEAGPTFPS
jgi:hypothetical protein